MTYGDNTPHSPANSKRFRDNFDKIFGQKRSQEEKTANENEDNDTVGTKKTTAKQKRNAKAKRR